MKIPLIFFTVAVLAPSAFSTNSYKQLALESGQVCALNYKNVLLAPAIPVDTDGLIIKETNYFDRITNQRKNFHCHFEVESSLKSSFPGLFVVIQHLHFRQDPESGECIDYVAIRPTDRNIFEAISNTNFNTKKSKYPWTKFCGDLRAKRDGGKDYAESEGLSKAGFLTDNNPGVEVEIFVRSPVVPSDGLELQIIFTPYKQCKTSWSEYRECGRGKCIKKSLYNDSYVNCPFLNCPDEDSCEVKIVEEELPSDIRTKVTLTAVTSIFCTFFLFLGCVWCCKYFEILCWSASNLIGRPNPVEMSPMAPSPPATPAGDPAPSKDLPPAYETLFPDR